MVAPGLLAIASPGTEPFISVKSDGAGTIQGLPHYFPFLVETSTLQVLAEWRNGA